MSLTRGEGEGEVGRLREREGESERRPEGLRLRLRLRLRKLPSANAATLSMLHHGEEDGDDVGEEGGNGRKEGDKGAVRLRFFVYV